jgi:hypothetical protein
VHGLQDFAEAHGGRLLRVLFLRLGRVSTDTRAAQLLSLSQAYFRQIISGRNIAMQTMAAKRVQNEANAGPGNPVVAPLINGRD